MEHTVDGIVLFEIKQGVLVGKYVEGVEIDLDMAKRLVDVRMEVQNGESFPLLIDITGLKSATKEARMYLGNEGAELITASAVISKSNLATIIFNFMTTVNLINKKFPIKFFNSYDEAMKWLEQYKQA